MIVSALDTNLVIPGHSKYQCNQPEREYYCSHMPIYYPISSKLAARAPENGAEKVSPLIIKPDYNKGITYIKIL